MPNNSHYLRNLNAILRKFLGSTGARIHCKGPYLEAQTAQRIERWAVFHFNHVQLTAGTDQMTPTSDPCLQRLLRRCR